MEEYKLKVVGHGLGVVGYKLEVVGYELKVEVYEHKEGIFLMINTSLSMMHHQIFHHHLQ